jgi:hypothetical protein
MATHVQSDLQEAIYDILVGDATLMTLVTNRVYDHVPDNTEYPYVAFGEARYDRWGSHTHEGYDVDFNIHTYTQSLGKLDAQAIMNRIYTLLHDVDITVTGYPTVVCEEQSSFIILDEDNRTYNGVQLYHIILGGNN